MELMAVILKKKKKKKKKWRTFRFAAAASDTRP